MPVPVLFIALALALSAVACGDSLGNNPPVEEPASGAAPALSPYEPDIDPVDFVARVDNPYMPLDPGTRQVYEAVEDGETERVVITVLSRTKEVMGIDATIVLDVVSVDGQIAEKTFDWFAQDRTGNVWYLGEESHEYEDGKPINDEGSWEAGVGGALPGIVMLAEPREGERYRQEYLAGEAEDMGQVIRTGATVDIALGEFQDVVVTKDWNPLEPKVVEHKHYAPGVGLILETVAKGGNGRLELISR
jgi:hypothetical protein